MEFTADRPGGSLGRRLGRILARELVETGLMFGLLLVSLWLLMGLLKTRSGDASGWLGFLGDLMRDAHGNPIGETFAGSIGLSAKLIGGSLALSIPLALLIGWLAAVYRPMQLSRFAVTLLSAIPMVAAGAFLQQWYGNHIMLPILVLAVTELTLGTMAAQVYTELSRELSEPYLDTTRAKGVWAPTHYWKPLLLIVVSTIRPRVPYLLSATIVVERIFTFDEFGLSSLILNAVEGAGDPTVLFWVSVLGLLLVRSMSLVERVLGGLLDPRQGGEVEASGSGVGSRVLDRQLAAATWELVLGVVRWLSELPVRLVAGTIGATRRVARLLAARLALGFFAWIELAVGLLLSAATLTALVLCMSGWTPHDPSAFLDQTFVGPSWGPRYYLGTDELGRDLLSNLLAAGRNLAVPALWGLLLPVGIGTLLGVWVGYGPRGWAQRVVSMLMDLFESLPKLIVILAALWAFEVTTGYLNRLVPLVGLTFTPLVFFAVRDRTRRITSEGFLEAQQALGSGQVRILGLHVLWNNCRGVILVQGSLVMGYILMMDLTLGYLGYSQADEDLITWGRLAFVGLREAGARIADGPWNPWVLYAPLLVVALFTTTFALWGDVLRTALRRTE